MKIKTKFDHKIRTIKNIWITMSDNCRLSARMWIPEDAEKNPVPAILEYIPYRKNDGTAVRDSIYHPYFAGHGYAAIRVDMRGSGDSEGLMLDEYLPQELEDAVSVITWLANQTWCNGEIGMMGKSWGGFNSLQVASLKPKELKAIITVCSSDDRYNDDVHFKGGCVMSTDMIGWATTMLAWNARPPDPLVLGEKWKEIWTKRLEQTPLLVKEWLSHQHRDNYWKHGSVCEDFSSIDCAVYAIGGWADPYSNAILRLMSGLSCPRKALIGPWSHEYPQRAVPGPQIGFAQECLRWWDHWLKGIDTGIMDEPIIRVWMPDSLPPKTHYLKRPGRWIAEPVWPPSDSNFKYKVLFLNRNNLNTIEEPESQLLFPNSQLVGLNAGVWFPMGNPGEFPGDQRSADSVSLCFDSEIFDKNIEILGNPELTLSLSSSCNKGLIAARLCDVAPDGSSLLVSWGLNNLTHYKSHEFPELLTKGERFVVNFQLNACAHSLKSGHKWRLSLSSAYFPHAWPSSELYELKIFNCTDTFLKLPYRNRRKEDLQLQEFLEPECSKPLVTKYLRKSTQKKTILHDAIENCYSIKYKIDNGRYLIVEDDIETEDISCDTLSIKEGEPLSLNVCCERISEIGRGKWNTRVEALGEMKASSDDFLIKSKLKVFEREKIIFEKSWDLKIPRKLV